ncbi:MAG TPA: DUF167 family protein [Xanthobacteraceae bacterium]|nr:DUF167 family protein [Xanthobacteraceae bacterium]
MDAGDSPWAVCADGLVVTVRLTPKAGRDSIDGIGHLSDGRSVLKARVSAAPSDGEANAALTRLLAQTLRIAPREIALVGGASSRIKRMLIKGDTRTVVAALEQIRAASAQ